MRSTTSRRYNEEESRRSWNFFRLGASAQQTTQPYDQPYEELPVGKLRILPVLLEPETPETPALYGPPLLVIDTLAPVRREPTTKGVEWMQVNRDARSKTKAGGPFACLPMLDASRLRSKKQQQQGQQQADAAGRRATTVEESKALRWGAERQVHQFTLSDVTSVTAASVVVKERLARVRYDAPAEPSPLANAGGPLGAAAAAALSGPRELLEARKLAERHVVIRITYRKRLPGHSFGGPGVANKAMVNDKADSANGMAGSYGGTPKKGNVWQADGSELYEEAEMSFRLLGANDWENASYETMMAEASQLATGIMQLKMWCARFGDCPPPEVVTRLLRPDMPLAAVGLDVEEPPITDDLMIADETGNEVDHAVVLAHAREEEERAIRSAEAAYRNADTARRAREWVERREADSAALRSSVGASIMSQSRGGGLTAGGAVASSINGLPTSTSAAPAQPPSPTQMPPMITSVISGPLGYPSTPYQTPPASGQLPPAVAMAVAAGATAKPPPMPAVPEPAGKGGLGTSTVVPLTVTAV